MKAVTDRSRLHIKLIDGSIIVAKVADWDENSVAYTIKKEDVEIWIPKHAIVKMEFERVELTKEELKKREENLNK